MSFPMEAKNVDLLNGGLSQFYVIVVFTRCPSVVLCVQGVSDWKLAAIHDISASHLCRPPMYTSDSPPKYSALYKLHR